MVISPSSPWREISGHDQGFQQQTPYDGTSLRLDADLYAEGTKAGFSPLEIDEMEVWQVAAAFSADYDRPEQKDDGPNNSSRPVSSNNKRDLLAERVAHSKGSGPKPEADKATPNADVMNLMNTIRGG